MRFERFIYGLFNNVGYKTVYTSQVKKLLKKKSIEELKQLQLRKGRKTDVVTMHFPSENIITRSYLQATNDVYGRDGVINHTLIMKVTDFLQEFPHVLNLPFNLIKEPLTVKFSDPPRSLEALTVETK